MIEEDSCFTKKKNYRLKKPCVVYDKNIWERKKNIAWMRGGDIF